MIRLCGGENHEKDWTGLMGTFLRFTWLLNYGIFELSSLVFFELDSSSSFFVPKENAVCLALDVYDR